MIRTLLSLTALIFGYAFPLITLFLIAAYCGMQLAKKDMQNA